MCLRQGFFAEAAACSRTAKESRLRTKVHSLLFTQPASRQSASFPHDPLGFQRPRGVEDGDDRDAHVGEDGLPHIGHPQRAQQQHQRFDPQREDDVLAHDRKRFLDVYKRQEGEYIEIVEEVISPKGVLDLQEEGTDPVVAGPGGLAISPVPEQEPDSAFERRLGAKRFALAEGVERHKGREGVGILGFRAAPVTILVAAPASVLFM